jgi:Na+/proline symporter/signal transduction histidine kinase
MTNFISTTWFVGTVSLLYVALLFAIATWGGRWIRTSWQPFVYSLTLAIFCTTWAFYGTIRQAATHGWILAPTYLGAILLITLGWRVFDRIIRIARQENSTTISDFISARYGHSRGIGMVVALLCLLGIVPYIALQLKAVSGSFQLMTNTTSAEPSWFGDPTFYIAAIMALFSILFGTRTVDSSESHQGMMLAIAFESLVKLLALLAVGIFAVFGIFNGFGDLLQQSFNEERIAAVLTEYSNPSVYLTHALLGAIAIIALPRHFHVAVVEYRSEQDIQTARWMFPLYLLLINLFVLPLGLVALLHQNLLGSFDFITLRIPMLFDQQWLALVAFLGGFSAGTSMVIISSITLATMLCNELILPLLIKLGGLGQDAAIKHRVLTIRRIAIVVVLLLSFFYYRLLSQFHSLAEIGVLSLVAVAQFAPAMLIGLIWQGANRAGAYCGIAVGFLIWIYSLFLPVLADTGWIPATFMDGPFSIDFLRPYALLGLEGLNPTVHGTFWSLLLNAIALVIGSLYYRPGFADIEQAQRFVYLPAPVEKEQNRNYAISNDDLRALLQRFLTPAKVAAFFESNSNPMTGRLLRKGQVDDEVLKSADRLLRSVLGRRGADLLLRNLMEGRAAHYSHLNALMDEVSEVVLFNRDLLNAVLHSLNQGITVVDENQNLVAWNQTFANLYQFPPGYLYVGQNASSVVRFIARSGGYGNGDTEAHVNKRLQEVREHQPLHYVRETSDGRHIELSGIPIADNLYVTVYSDITEYRQIETQLRSANEALEVRVAERTQKLMLLNEDLKKANNNKTRFLAAAGHDLVQPLNSASLFSASIINKLNRNQETDPTLYKLLHPVAIHLNQSLTSAESLLSELLEISKLDADIVRPNQRAFALRDVLDSLAGEFQPLAEQKGLNLRYVKTGLWVHTDPTLLRRILQNLLSNALRYTQAGSLLLGVRRKSGLVEIQVLDTGVGIPADQQDWIFEEFHRLAPDSSDHQAKGLGLGLSIVQRLGRLLQLPVRVQSQPGKGSCFSVTITPLAVANEAAEPSASSMAENCRTGLILCIDNEQQILDGMANLLSDWGFQVAAAKNLDAAKAVLDQRRPTLAIVDYHLDCGENGLDLMIELKKDWDQPVPCILATADYTDEVKQKANQLDYFLLRKPLKPLTLRALISRLC